MLRVPFHCVRLCVSSFFFIFTIIASLSYCHNPHHPAVRSFRISGLLPQGGTYLFGDDGSGGLDEPEMVARCRASQAGSKWTLTAFASWLAAEGHDVGTVWHRVCDVVAKTALAAAVSTMHKRYKSHILLTSRYSCLSTWPCCFVVV